ncbi:peptidoglycan-binding protein [Streptomyces sp. NPDC088387]|uniref:peptidoglycan-binding domain-containing protein n=1 Tax=Streptomyces sp. NPDC088387 TaxID=3365859 RepID=UPI00381CF7E9
MRALTKTFVSVTCAVGIAAGTLATAGTSAAAPAPAAQTSVSTQDAGVLAVNNLGLSTGQARNVQCWLNEYWGYPGPFDGLLGTNSWMAFQRQLRAHWDYNDSIDGIVGPNTVRALQRLLKAAWGYTGAIDGDAGDGTRAAFKRFANNWGHLC